MISLIASALILLGQATAQPVNLAAILQGEAGVCGTEAMLTVAHIYQRNPKMNGRQAPTRKALTVATGWRNEVDPTEGRGKYIFSRRDMQRPSVWALKTKQGLSMVRAFNCGGGSWLFVYG